MAVLFSPVPSDDAHCSQLRYIGRLSGAAQAVIEAELGCPALFLQGCVRRRELRLPGLCRGSVARSAARDTVLKGLTESAEGTTPIARPRDDRALAPRRPAV